MDKNQSAGEWLEGAEEQTGSWWEHWADWVIPRSGDQIPAPTTLGGGSFPEQDDAPGFYVRQAN